MINVISIHKSRERIENDLIASLHQLEVYFYKLELQVLVMKKNNIRKNNADGTRKEQQARFIHELRGKKVERKPIGRDFEVSEYNPVTGEKIW